MRLKTLIPKSLATGLITLLLMALCPGRASAEQTISGTWQLSQLTDNVIKLSGATTIVVDCNKTLKQIGADIDDPVTLDIIFQSAEYTLNVEQSGEKTAIYVNTLNVMGPGNLIVTSRCIAIGCHTVNFTNVYVKAKGRNDVSSETDETNSIGFWVQTLNINNSEVYATGRRYGIYLPTDGKVTITGDDSKVTAEGRGHHKTVWGGDSGTGDEDCWGRGIGCDATSSVSGERRPAYGTIDVQGGELNVQSDICGGIWCKALIISGGKVTVNSDLYSKQKDDAAITCALLKMSGGTLDATSNKHGIHILAMVNDTSRVSGGHLTATGGKGSYGLKFEDYGKGFYLSGDDTQVDANGSNGGIYCTGLLSIDRIGLNAKARADGYYAVYGSKIHITQGDNLISGVTSNKEPFYAYSEIRVFRPFALNGEYQNMAIPSSGTYLGHYFSLNGNTVKKRVELTKPSINDWGYSFNGISGTYNVGNTITLTVPQGVTDYVNFSNAVRTVRWWSSETSGGYGILAGTGNSFVARANDANKYIYATVSYDTHTGSLRSNSVKIGKTPNTANPVKPTLTYATASDKIAVTNTKSDQEYLVLTTETSDITEAQWANAEPGGSNSYMLLDGGTKGQLNYVYTRLRETATTAPGEKVLHTSIYYGSATGMTDFTLTATTTSGAALQLDANKAYNVAYNSVVKLTVAPVPSSVSWQGVTGENWLINMDTSGGTMYGSDMGYLYTDAACTNPIVVDGEHYYKTVYYKFVNNSHNGLTGMVIDALATVGSNTVDHWLAFNVSNTSGTWDVMNIAPSLFQVEHGSVITLPYTTNPGAATCSTLTAQAQSNSWGGTAPTLTFNPTAKTVTIDATNSVANSSYYYYTLYADGKALALKKGVEVLPATPKSIVLNQHDVLLDPGATLQLTATVLPSIAAQDATVTWSASNDYATISSTGLVTISSNQDCLGEELLAIATTGELSDTCRIRITGEKFPLWVKGTQVNSMNQEDVLGDGKVAYEAGKLSLNGANLQLSTNKLSLESEIPGLIINVKGTNTMSSTADAVYLREPTRLTGNGEFKVTSTGTGSVTVALAGFKDLAVEDSVHVQAANNSSSGMGSWIMGNLSVEGTSAQFRANGKWFSLLLGSLNGVITEPEGGYVQYYEDLETSTVYDTAGNFVRNAWVTITGEEVEPELLRGDVNGDGKVNVSDVTALINMILGVLNVNEVRADVNQDGKVNVSDVTFLINIILGVIH